MITSLRVQNFKPWSDTGRVRLAPITVLFGSNSSGKSSLNQFLLLLKQTAESADRKRVLHTGDDSTPVDLGSFSDLIHRHDESLPLTFELSWLTQQPFVVEDPRTIDRFAGDELRFEGVIRKPSGSGELEVESMTYSVLEAGEASISAGLYAVTERPRRKGTWQYELKTENYQLVRNQGRAWQLPPPSRFYGFPDEAIAYYQNSGFTADLVLALEEALQRVVYLGPLREQPRRIYPWAGDTPEHVGWSGERSIEAIRAASSRRLSRGYRKKSESFQEIVARWLHELGLIDSFSVEPVAGQERLNRVRVRTPGSAEDVDLTDVGFGISQVLPVVVQSFYAQPGSTVIIEQPEIHLHPAVQSKLADLFIEAIEAREDGEDRGIQFIIESHSEHFLRRLQRRIAEKQIAPDSTALYFATRSRTGTSLRELDVDLYGSITNWPPDFFGNPMDDVASQSRARLNRLISGQPEGK